MCGLSRERLTFGRYSHHRQRRSYVWSSGTRVKVFCQWHVSVSILETSSSSSVGARVSYHTLRWPVHVA